MKKEDLPEELKELFGSIKHGSVTIESDLQDALVIAENINDLKINAIDALNDLIAEAGAVRDAIGRYVPDKVWVVTQLHAGSIFNTAVRFNHDDANKIAEEWRKDLSDDEDVDIQECEIL